LDLAIKELKKVKRAVGFVSLKPSYQKPETLNSPIRAILYLSSIEPSDSIRLDSTRLDSAMAVRFKFRSSANFDSVDIGGPSVSVRDLKSKIIRHKNLDICQDLDLLFSDALTGQGQLSPPLFYLFRLCMVPEKMDQKNRVQLFFFSLCAGSS